MAVQNFALFGKNIVIGLTDLAQKLIILIVDLALVFYGTIALGQDWSLSCAENLWLYAFMCVLLAIADIAWEILRCSLESSLDRLQAEIDTDGTPVESGSKSLLTPDHPHGSPCATFGSPSASADCKDTSTIFKTGLGVRLNGEKLKKRKRSDELHFWSIVFAVGVAVTFSCFSTHDEACREDVPNLYNYVRVFTYAYIFRVGVLLLWVCCRKVKNYEDSAALSGAFVKPTRS